MNLRESATDAVRKAVVQGRLPSLQYQHCVDCGKRATQYDHRDYSKPLVVEPVCRRCNRLRGPAVGWNSKDHPQKPANGMVAVHAKVSVRERQHMTQAARAQSRTLSSWLRMAAVNWLSLTTTPSFLSAGSARKEKQADGR